MIQIPKQLQKPDIKFCKLLAKEKKPFEKDWTKKGYSYDDASLITHIQAGGNYGVIGGYGNLRILDIDDKELAKEIQKKLDTLTTQTGSGGMHFYLFSNYDKNHVLVNELGELRAKNYQVVGANCIHPNGNAYRVINNVPIKEVDKFFIEELISPYLRHNETMKEDLVGEITRLNEGKDTSRSARDYREVCKLIGQGMSKDRVFREMEAFAKWSSSPDQYKELTYSKALGYIEAQKEVKLDFKTKEPKDRDLEILKDKNIFKKITKEEFDKKITGEEKSRKAIFLALCSIWLKDMEVPMNTMVSSLSSAGKSYTCKQITKIFPKELVLWRSKISGEAFTYWHVNEENFSWDGKICYLEDISQNVLDSDTFKVMCSDGSVATVVRNQKAVDLIVNGKPCILLTTATTNPTSEILNRFNIVQLDETKEQTKKITFEQALDNKKEEYNKNIISALACLERMNVSVPFAIHIHKYMDMVYSWEDVRMRRDFSRLIGFIKCSATLHQFQRDKDEEGRVIANEIDYEIARECINYVQTNTLKGLTHKLRRAYEAAVTEQEFTAKEIHAKYPFANQKMWYNYLGELSERGMLTQELRDIPESKKRVTYFLVPKNTSFNLPNMEELLRFITNDTTDTFNTINTNVTKDSKKEATNVRNVSNVLNSEGCASSNLDNSKPKVEVIKI